MAVLLVNQDAGGSRAGVIAGLLEIIVEFLNARLVRYRWKQIGRTGRGVGGVDTALPVDLIQVLGLGVVLKTDTLCLEGIYRQKLMGFSQLIFWLKNMPQVGKISSPLTSIHPL